MTAPALSVPTPYGRCYRQPNTHPDTITNIDDALATGLLVPSVTNIISVLDKPFLRTYYANKAAEAAIEIAQSYPGHLQSRPRQARTWLAAAAARHSGAAADLGTLVHGLIERIVAGEDPDIPDQAAAHIDTWHTWVTDHAVTFHHSEATCYGTTSDQLGYAGTADFIATIDGTRVVGDYKCGRTVSTDAALQLSALAHTTTYATPTGTTPLEPVTGGVVVHLTPTGYTTYTADLDEPWPLFERLRGLWDFHARNLASRAPLYLTRNTARAPRTTAAPAPF